MTRFPVASNSSDNEIVSFRTSRTPAAPGHHWDTASTEWARTPGHNWDTAAASTEWARTLGHNWDKKSLQAA
ncbi:MAG: hypothetical protein M3419_02595 [Actinomycetota bacterium]|nr:hypothetical protein [Actinomycetota bacterium]